MGVRVAFEFVTKEGDVGAQQGKDIFRQLRVGNDSARDGGGDGCRAIRVRVVHEKPPGRPLVECVNQIIELVGVYLVGTPSTESVLELGQFGRELTIVCETREVAELPALRLCEVAGVHRVRLTYRR